LKSKYRKMSQLQLLAVNDFLRGVAAKGEDGVCRYLRKVDEAAEAERLGVSLSSFQSFRLKAFGTIKAASPPPGKAGDELVLELIDQVAVLSRHVDRLEIRIALLEEHMRSAPRREALAR
jgi:hypothetical protein